MLWKFVLVPLLQRHELVLGTVKQSIQFGPLKIALNLNLECYDRISLESSGMQTCIGIL